MTSKIIRLSSLISSSASLAAESLSLGHVIAVPTDTIYGITCLVQHSAAVDRLYSIKVKIVLKKNITLMYKCNAFAGEKWQQTYCNLCGRNRRNLQMGECDSVETVNRGSVTRTGTKIYPSVVICDQT